LFSLASRRKSTNPDDYDFGKVIVLPANSATGTAAIRSGEVFTAITTEDFLNMLHLPASSGQLPSHVYVSGTVNHHSLALKRGRINFCQDLRPDHAQDASVHF